MFVLRWLLRLVVLVVVLAAMAVISYRIAYRDWPWNQPAKIAVCGGHWERSTLPHRTRHELRAARLYEVKRVPPFVGEQLLSATPVHGESCDDRLYLRTIDDDYIVYFRGGR